MSIFGLCLRNIISRPLSTALSLILLSLGVGMITFLLHISNRIQGQMENNIKGIDMVVGAKGSPLQLILSAVYHIDAPTGNISYEEAETLGRNRLIDFTIPLSYGDSFKSHRIVGTTHEYPQLYDSQLSIGRLWQSPLEVTLGAEVASNLGLELGDSFIGSHGLSDGGEGHADHSYNVVGIMEQSNSVIDQLILTSTESVWEVHDHEHEEHSEGDHEHDEHDDHAENHDDEHEHDDHAENHHDEHEHDESREITALLVKFKNPMGLIQVPRMVNENTSMQAAVPAYEIGRLYNLMGVGIDTLKTVAWVIIAVAALSVFISLYNSFNERQYELALMRTYGATRWQLVWLMVLEGLLMTVAGFILGSIISRVGLALVSDLMETSYHYGFSLWHWMKDEGLLFIMAVAIGSLASLIPAIQAFKLDISKKLADA